MPHSIRNVPALVMIVWPLLPGHLTEDVATGPVEVAVAAILLEEDAIAAREEVAAREAALKDEALDETATAADLAPHTPVLKLGVPREFFR
jgi:hypothetical protein